MTHDRINVKMQILALSTDNLNTDNIHQRKEFILWAFDWISQELVEDPPGEVTPFTTVQ